MSDELFREIVGDKKSLETVWLMWDSYSVIRSSGHNILLTDLAQQTFFSF